MVKMHFVGNNWILAYEFRNLIAVKWHGILREVALGQRFRARTSLKSVAEHSWETNMAQCVAGGFLECLKANGEAKALCRRWLPCQRSLK